jgi:outer membrane protein W
MKVFYKIILISIFFSTSNTFAQLSFSHEVGFSFGPVTMQSDYGERHYLPSSTATSFGIAAVHYLSFYGSNYNWRNGSSYFSDHFKLKTEISLYFNNNLEHKFSKTLGNSSQEQRLAAMKGTTKLFNIGTQLEYYFKNLEDYGLLFNDNDKFAPYVGAGIQYNSFTPTLTSDLGNYLTDPSILPDQWQNNAVFVEKGSTVSLTLSTGTRYKIDNVELVLDAKWQYFFSDKIDGLDSSVSGNKFNDTLIFFSLGAVFNLEGFGRR